VDTASVVVVITGGSRGIGKEVARALGAALRGGSTVVVCSTAAGRGAEAALADLRVSVARRAAGDGSELPISRGVGSSGGGGLVAFEHMVLDVASLESVTACAVALERRFGRVDVLVNNAGIAFKVADKTPFPVSEPLVESICPGECSAAAQVVQSSHVEKHGDLMGNKWKS
jgi:NAD(P)-dependent dehydrogenase (short-subunit alcohol dehydrogenase family)